MTEPIETEPSRDHFEARYRREATLNRHIEVSDLAWANILPTLLKMLPAEGHFLDVGSGNGTLACLVAARGLRVTALDKAPSGVAVGIAQAQALGVTGVTFRECDLDSPQRLPVDGLVDVAFASEILEHVTDDRDVLDRLRDCMRPGGWLIATSPSNSAPMHRLHLRFHGVDHMDQQRHHLRRYSLASFGALATDSGFRDISVTPIAGAVRDFVYGSRLGLRTSRLIKRPVTPVVQWLDRMTLGVAQSQLLLTARAPSSPVSD